MPMIYEKKYKGNRFRSTREYKGQVEGDRFISELLIVNTLLINLVKNKSCIFNPLSSASKG
jgi:hypothetical protein